MCSPARMLTGRLAVDDLDGCAETNTESTTVPLGHSDSARGVSLLLRFDGQELVVDDRPSSITIGRAEEHDVVINGHLSSPLHVRIGRSNIRPTSIPRSER